MLVRSDDGREWFGTSGVSYSPAPPQAPDENGQYSWAGEPVEAQMLFRIGSLTKTFTAALILRLADEGLLTLDDTLEQWLPGAVANSEIITIRQLLNHTSGVPEFNDSPDFVETRPWTPEEVLALVANDAPQFQPGTSFKYTNTNYFLLGLIAERAGGDTYETLVQTMLFDPLNLQHTYAPRTAEFPEAHVNGYEQNADGSFRDTTNVEPTAPWAAGCMISNVFDLATWVESFINGSLISSELHAEQLDFLPSVVDPRKGYGLGTIKMADGRLGHSGSFQGFFAGAWRINNYTIVALANSRTPHDLADDASAAVTELILSGQTE